MASEIDESLLDNMFGARDDDERDAGPEYDDSDSDEDAAGPGEVDGTRNRRTQRSSPQSTSKTRRL